jgi:hypothetical protein
VLHCQPQDMAECIPSSSSAGREFKGASQEMGSINHTKSEKKNFNHHEMFFMRRDLNVNLM